jgi:ADP-ribosylglycohydrolase
MVHLSADYAERVYAGVLGKIIGVYLGRPFEGWTFERLMEKLGEINYYVQEKLGVALVVVDDDISGTLAFLRALPDHGNSLELTAQQIGETWLNYLIEERTVLWWGGLGNSTEHTAYLRLKSGIPAPRSGSMELNSKVVAEQIGAQIFIDGWAMVSPGDPAQAVDLARKAASVSHDGEAIYGAQVLAAMEALAFVESDLNKLLDTAVTFIPRDSVIYRMIADLREWRAAETDWRKTRLKIVENYGYDRYGGNCHMVPNHALIIHSLLHGDDNFQKTLMIVNNCGWDTDCNAGNVGCLMGIKNGLAGLDTGPDYRTPVADRIYLPTADSGGVVTDAAAQALKVINIGCALAGEKLLAPKAGARFHFAFPGSVQGFMVEDSRDVRGTLEMENVLGHSQAGERSLALHYKGVAQGRPARAATATFLTPEAQKMGGYGLSAAPTLYPGQILQAAVSADECNQQPVTCGLYLRGYGAGDEPVLRRGAQVLLHPGKRHEFSWILEEAELGVGAPVFEVGVEIRSLTRAEGTVYLDYLTWDGTPRVSLSFPEWEGEVWKKTWVNAADQVWFGRGQEVYRLMQNEGTGMLLAGCREWTDYRLSASVSPHLMKTCGIAARVQGLRRYYALLLGLDGRLRLVKSYEGECFSMAEVECAVEWDRWYRMELVVEGTHLCAWLDGQLLFEVKDGGVALDGGGIALLCEEGRTGFGAVKVEPVR